VLPAAPFFEAPYPASSTALIISAADAVPSTPIELVSRLTEHPVTPGTFDTAFSTLALHAAQLIPVTLYCSIIYPLPVLSRKKQKSRKLKRLLQAVQMII
jgi:hypothetical protein